MQGAAEEFQKRGVRLLAVSVDPPETTRKHAEKMGYSAYTFLADEEMEVIRAWDFVHENGSFKVMGGAVSRPAEFLLDPEGIIRWRNLSPTYKTKDRLMADQALRAIDEIQAADE